MSFGPRLSGPNGRARQPSLKRSMGCLHEVPELIEIPVPSVPVTKTNGKQQVLAGIDS